MATARVDSTAGGFDVGIEVAHEGAGGRPLMLVHGFTGAKEDFTPWLAPLAERGWHAAAPDLRGHGQSDQPADEDAYGTAVFAQDVRTVAAGLGWDRFTLLGHSMGGMTAQVLAIETPDLLDGLILMDTCPGPVPELTAELVGLGQMIVRSGGLVAYQAAMAGAGIGMNEADARLRQADPGYAAWCDAKLLASSPSMFCRMLAEFEAAIDRSSRLAAVCVPTLVMCGALDVWMLDASHQLHEAIPGASLAIIDGGGHCPQFESTDAWWAALTTFLDELVPLDDSTPANNTAVLTTKVR